MERMVEQQAWTHPTDGPVHTHFGLSYSSYQVLHRSLLQSMPIEWQQRWVGCMEELRAAFDHVPQAEGYTVEAATSCDVSELTEAQMRQLGITEDWDRDPDGPVYTDASGRELDADEEVMLPVPDPVPHYNRGRTYIQPRNPDGEACGDVLEDRVCVLQFGWHEKARHVDRDGNWWQQARGRLSNKRDVAA